MSRWEPEPLPPLRAALISQVLGGLVAIGLTALLFPRLLDGALPGFPASLAIAAFQGCCAAFVSRRLDAPPWWLPIHLVFMPAVVAAGRLRIAPGWYLAGFVLLLLVFWRTDKSRVPLYLSNAATAAALSRLLPVAPCRVIDLGCGNGALLAALARQRPDCRFLGIEHAPLPWLWARFAARGQPNCRIAYGDFWRQDLRGFDLVYAFLSPAAMPRLWTKARGEMAPGSTLVSNSFAVPDVAADYVEAVPDPRRTRLFCYRPGT